MRVFDFSHALLRAPGRSVVNGLRSDASAVPEFETVRAEHAAYAAALAAAGLAVEILPPLEAYPDSVFIEDPALVFREVAILLRPGASTRLGEAEEMREPLGRRFARVLELTGDEYADGGDVLVTPAAVFIGLSARTSRKGAEALAGKLAELGKPARIVQTPPGVLHFKTAVSLLDEETVLATAPMAASGLFGTFRVLTVPAGEEAAANALRVNDRVLLGDGFPRTIELLARHGYSLVPLGVREIGKLNAGLSCMSLRWRAP